MKSETRPVTLLEADIFVFNVKHLHRQEETHLFFSRLPSNHFAYVHIWHESTKCASSRVITRIHCCSLHCWCPNILYIDLLSFCVCYFTTIIFGAPAAQSPKMHTWALFVCLSASKNSRNAQSILMKFDIGQYSDVCRHIPNVIKIRQITGTFAWRPTTLLISLNFYRSGKITHAFYSMYNTLLPLVSCFSQWLNTS